MTSKWEKFCLLMWKNWLLQWRHKIQTIFEIVIPVLFCALVVLIRSLVDPDTYTDASIYEPLGLNSLKEVRKMPEFQIKFLKEINDRLKKNEIKINYELVFCPDNELLRKLVKKAKHLVFDNVLVSLFFGDSGIVGVENATELEKYMINRNPLVGLEFDQDYKNITELPDLLKYAIRFPGELRTQFGPMWANWRTDFLFPFISAGGARNKDYNDGGVPPGYYRESFLTLQNTIFRAFADLKNDDRNITIPDFYMRRFPYPPFIQDPLLQGLERMLSVFILLSFVYPCINMVKFITTEKEKQLKESMKIMGLPNWLHWTAWFCKCFIYLFFATLVMLLLLKVNWYSGMEVTVFTNSGWTVLWFFLLVYSVATIMFCFMLSVFFSKANTAAAVAGLLWFVIYSPFSLLIQRYDSVTFEQKMVASFFSNAAMGFGTMLILRHEGTGAGLQWSNLFEPINIDDDLTVGHTVVMMLVASFVYFLVALYVEQIFPGDYGVPEPWYFPLTKSFWWRESTIVGIEDINGHANQLNTEPEPVGKFVGVETKNLRKVFPNHKVAVNGLSLRMFEDQITVLLGHNGAGKTTTMSMLTGMIPPTSGTALVNGFDLRGNINAIRGSLGLCPQHNVLFDELTVAEHIEFFGRLKGLHKSEIAAEIESYVALLQLEDKTNAQSKTLSGGMKRKLSIGIALCANSKVVLCDEPTSGVDPAARRALWDLLLAEKKGRTILLSTHFMDEADILGDRIAIMSNGELKAVGSSFYLKKTFGIGYRLVCVKTSKCETQKVTNLLRKYVPEVEIYTDIGTELSYQLHQSHSPIFEKMLADLEENGQQLGLQSYGVSLSTMEEVFMKLGTDEAPEEEEDETKINGFAHHGNSNGTNGHINQHETDDLLPEIQLVSGITLLFYQIQALFLKKMYHTTRNWVLLFLQNLIPVVFLVLTIIVVRSWGGNKDLPALALVPDKYNPTVSLLELNSSWPYNDFTQREILFYRSQFRDLARRQELVDAGQDMNAYYLKEAEKMITRVNTRFLFGASMNQSTVTAWFSNQPYHAAPISLGLAHNATLRAICNRTECGIHLTNKPLPFRPETRFDMLQAGNNMGFQLAFNLGFAMAFVAGFYAIFYIKERVSKSKLLQFVSGVNIASYWTTAFIWDYLTFTVTALISLFTIVAFQETGWSNFMEIGRCLLVLLCFIFAVIPFTYLFSLMFSVPASGFTKLSIIYIFTGVAVFTVVFTMSFDGFKLKDTADTLTNIFLVFPHFALSDALSNLNVLNTIISVCDKRCAAMPNCNLTQMCQEFPFMAKCCERDFFEWNDPGIGKNIFYMLMTGTTTFVILLLFEYRIFEMLLYQGIELYRGPPLPESEDRFVDQDVKDEKNRINYMEPDEIVRSNLVLKNMTKVYKNFNKRFYRPDQFLAVNQLCIGVNDHECFGLLGVNGAGKTSTFKMLTGDEKISLGNAWVQGLSLKSKMKDIYRRIGYCPQFDALIEDLTGRETMRMYGMIRGIPKNKIAAMIERIAKELNFTKHLDKQVKAYSGGNKRKLSTAVALIGNPIVIYLDEPTTGMDPNAKRHLWNAVCKIRDQGKTIILTSHSMEECEALCTRLAIMVNGEFKCLGSSQHLKNKFSHGFIVTVKVKRKEESSNSQLVYETADLEALKQYIQRNFIHAVLKEEYQGLMTYQVSYTELKWSQMFAIMEEAKRTLNVEDYSVGQTSLEQVFLSFTKYQREALHETSSNLNILSRAARAMRILGNGTTLLE